MDFRLNYLETRINYIQSDLAQLRADFRDRIYLMEQKLERQAQLIRNVQKDNDDLRKAMETPTTTTSTPTTTPPTATAQGPSGDESSAVTINLDNHGHERVTFRVRHIHNDKGARIYAAIMERYGFTVVAGNFELRWNGNPLGLNVDVPKDAVIYLRLLLLR